MLLGEGDGVYVVVVVGCLVRVMVCNVVVVVGCLVRVMVCNVVVVVFCSYCIALQVNSC